MRLYRCLNSAALPVIDPPFPPPSPFQAALQKQQEDAVVKATLEATSEPVAAALPAREKVPLLNGQSDSHSEGMDREPERLEPAEEATENGPIGTHTQRPGTNTHACTHTQRPSIPTYIHAYIHKRAHIPNCNVMPYSLHLVMRLWGSERDEQV